GQDASVEDYPFMVGVLPGEQLCGGTLIASRWVLTAIHCLETPDGIISPAEIEVVIGSSNIDEGGVRVNPVQVLTHPSYAGGDSPDQAFDIALLELPQDQLRPRVPLVTADLLDNASVGTLATVLGWGLLNDDFQNGPTSSILQQAQVPIVSNTDCADALAPAYVINEGALCAGFAEGGIDSCAGDSGGPLLVPYQDGWLQAGVTSFGVGCAQPNSPGGYARVSTASSWILSNVPAELSQRYVVTGFDNTDSLDFGNFR
ncbi:MAG: serine protease, partial [Deinococcota bacterium]